MDKHADDLADFLRWMPVAILGVALAACATPVDERVSYSGAPNEVLAEIFSGARASRSLSTARPGKKGGDLLYVGSFNIQNFGPTKAGRPDVMKRLADIVRQHDIIAIQEVSDRNEKAPALLLDYVNMNGSTFDYVLSPRSGLQPDDKGSQEQYAIYYDTKSVKLVRDLQVFDDKKNDEFQREPQVASFQTVAGNFDFALINIHTRPESAVEEIDGLDRVASWAAARLGNVPLIMLGDFNGSCGYAKPDELDELSIRGPDYTWVVPDTADTNLAPQTCAYDRIVLSNADRYSGKWSVWRAFESLAISDHWPVWAAFRIED